MPRKPLIPRRWGCMQCGEIEAAAKEHHKLHGVVRLCGYQTCMHTAARGRLTCDDEHGVWAMRTSLGLPGVYAPATPTGLWLLGERLRLGRTRQEVGRWLKIRSLTLYHLEVDNGILPAVWVEALMAEGFKMPLLAAKATPATFSSAFRVQEQSPSQETSAADPAHRDRDGERHIRKALLDDLRARATQQIAQRLAELRARLTGPKHS